MGTQNGHVEPFLESASLKKRKRKSMVSGGKEGNRTENTKRH